MRQHREVAAHRARPKVRDQRCRLCDAELVSAFTVEVSAQKFGFEWECPCCGVPEPDGQLSIGFTRRSGVKVIRHQTRRMDIPYCKSCLSHIRFWRVSRFVLSVFGWLAVIIGLMISGRGGAEAGAIAFVFLLGCGLGLMFLIRLAAKTRCKPSCVTLGPAAEYLGWSGSVSTFRFVSPRFASRFVKKNARSVVNLDPALRRIVSQGDAALPPQSQPEYSAYSSPQQQRATSASAAASTDYMRESVDPVLNWINVIESFKGAVARRNALERALSELKDPAAQRQVILAASRIEVAAVLDKVDSLATAPAKRRHLLKAIEGIQADNIPDDLQAAELEQLHERIRSLG